MEYIIIILIGVLVLLESHRTYRELKLKKTKQGILFIPKGFKEDFELLSAVIDKNIKQCIVFDIAALNFQLKDSNITDDDVIEYANIVIKNVMDTLSPQYVLFLETYYLSKNKLLDYVTENVMTFLRIHAIELNDAKTKRAVYQKETEKVFALNNIPNRTD